MAIEDEEQFVAAEGAAAVGEAEAVELRVMTKALVNSGHADEDHREVLAVVAVAEYLERGGSETLGFIDDEQLYQVGDSTPC